MATPGTLFTVPSSSGGSYEIKLGGDGNVYCTCPAWKFQKLPPKERTCKHIKATASKIAAALGQKPVTAPVAKPSAPLSPVQAPIAQTAAVVAALPAAPVAVAPVAAPVEVKSAKVKLAEAKVKAAQAALALAQAEVELAEALCA